MLPPLDSLSWKTDLLLLDRSIVTDRGEYVVVRSPERPGFYWGNFLLFRKGPGEEDVDRWIDLFGREIGAHQPADHLVFGWDSPEGEPRGAQAFIERGFRFDRSTVLTASELHRPYDDEPAYSVRAIADEEEWERVIDLQVLMREEEFESEPYRGFCRGRRQDYGRLIERGLGEWFGAFEGEELLGTLGIFAHDGVARYQAVQTHPDHQRGGVAGNLLYAAGRWATNRLGAESFVIVTDPESTAERLYRRCGFTGREWQPALERW